MLAKPAFLRLVDAAFSSLPHASLGAIDIAQIGAAFAWGDAANTIPGRMSARFSCAHAAAGASAARRGREGMMATQPPMLPREMASGKNACSTHDMPFPFSRAAPAGRRAKVPLGVGGGFAKMIHRRHITQRTTEVDGVSARMTPGAFSAGHVSLQAGRRRRGGAVSTGCSRADISFLELPYFQPLFMAEATMLFQ